LYRITVRGEQVAAAATISDAPKRASVGLLGLEPT
jgi:hypothetical protein